VGAALSGLLLALVAGIYIAAQPRRYLDGLVILFPVRHRPSAREALRVAGVALHKWLVGQLVAMTLVGLLAGVGLWLLDVPSPLALALIAGLLEFVPVAGPFASAVPAILLALAIGWEKAALVAILYLGIQQIEGNLITPLVQQQSVDLPPALTLFAMVAFGLLFGLLGVLLAAPLTVCLYVWVKTLYLHDLLVPSGADEDDRR
jgi:predicted PurR-regulated permease PerM